MRRSKRIANKNAAAGITALPNHIVCDILSRLPLNSVFTCKRVCKTWRNLTLEPYFAKSYLSRSPFSLVSYRRGTKSSPFQFRILQLNDPIDFNNCTTMNFNSTGAYLPRTHTYMVASCTGLFLLASFPPSRELLVAYNPLRAQHLILPTPPKKPHNCPVGFGIGHSAVTDRYKVVRLVVRLTGIEVPTRLDVDVYTVGIDTKWRSIEDAACPPSLFTSELVFLNGALHWIALEDSWLICYFNIEKEQFGRFPLPAHVGDDCGGLAVTVINNCLCIHKSPFAQFAVNNLWTMKDYGDFGSWTLECVVELWNAFPHRLRGFLKPLKLLKDGSLLMSVEEFTKGRMDRPKKNQITLASYDPQTRLLKKMKYRGTLFLDTPYACVPCFFSPMDALK